MRFFWLLFISWALTACAPAELPGDETQLRSQIDALLQAARDRQVEPIMAVLAEDFSGKGRESTDRRAIRQFLAYQFMRNPTVQVLASNLQLDILPPTAQISLDVAVAGGNGVLPERGQIYHLQTEWQKRGEGWRLTRAEWTGKL